MSRAPVCTSVRLKVVSSADPLLCGAPAGWCARSQGSTLTCAWASTAGACTAACSDSGSGSLTCGRTTSRWPITWKREAKPGERNKHRFTHVHRKGCNQQLFSSLINLDESIKQKVFLLLASTVKSSLWEYT